MADFTHETDVLVCGGGVAGVAAALAAARAGARTTLLEKTILTGGLATAGLINIYLPLCDGRGTQVTFGIAEELLHACMRYGPGTVPDWRQAEGRYRVTFSPAAFALALDEALEAAGVDLWLDTLACRPVVSDGRVDGVEVETKAGRGRFAARCVIDATGDADIAHRAGAACAEGLNCLAAWAVETNVDGDRAHTINPGAPNRVRMVRCGKFGPEAIDHEQRRGTDAQSVTRFVLDGRAMLRERYRTLQRDKGDAARNTDFPIALPAMAQYRTTRRIAGRTTLRGGQDGVRFQDSVGLVADWRTAGPVWEVPYGALLPGVDHLLAAGRCIASAGDAWEVMRVIPAAALTGQAAGVAAALAAADGVSPRTLPAEAVQRTLEAEGVPCHLNQVFS